MPDPHSLVPQLEGPLRKRNSRGTWQQRWWVLSGMEIRYYNDQRTTSAKGIINIDSVISVRSVTMIDKEPYCIEIRCRERTYQISAPLPQDAAKWITAVEACRQVFAARTGGPRGTQSAKVAADLPSGTRAPAGLGGSGGGVSSPLRSTGGGRGRGLKVTVRVALQWAPPKPAGAAEGGGEEEDGAASASAAAAPAVRFQPDTGADVDVLAIGRAMEGALRVMGVAAEVALTAGVPEGAPEAGALPSSHSAGVQLAATLLSLQAAAPAAAAPAAAPASAPAAAPGSSEGGAVPGGEEGGGALARVAAAQPPLESSTEHLVLEAGLAYGVCELPSLGALAFDAAAAAAAAPGAAAPGAAAGAVPSSSRWQSHVFVAMRCVGPAGAAVAVAVSTAAGEQLSEMPTKLPALSSLTALTQEAFGTALSRQLRPPAIALHMQASLSSSAAALSAAAAYDPERALANPIRRGGQLASAPTGGARPQGAAARERLPSRAEAEPSLLQLYRLMDGDDFDVDQLDLEEGHASGGDRNLGGGGASGAAPIVLPVPPPPSLSRPRDVSLTTKAFIDHMESTDFEVAGSDPLSTDALRRSDKDDKAGGGSSSSKSAAAAAAAATDNGDDEDTDEDEEADEAAPSKAVEYKGRWTDPKMFRAIRQVVSLNKKRFQVSREQGLTLLRLIASDCV